MHRNQNGFSVVEVVIVIVVVGLIGGVGWYALHAKQSADKSSKPSKSSVVTTSPEKANTVQKKIPAGYKQYADSQYGFSFAYPEAVGEITTADSDGNHSILAYAKSVSKQDAFAPYTESPLYVQVDKLDSFVTRAAKYGPMLEYINNRWVVSDKQGGDVNNGGRTVGDEYNAAVAKTVGNIKVYDFSTQDEGCYHALWVFRTSKAFTSITLPSVCADEIDAIPQSRLDNYKAVVAQVLNTLEITN
jgi:prepilin-type N-terminal cleavage/methylation domain-containing protein